MCLGGQRWATSISHTPYSIMGILYHVPVIKNIVTLSWIARKLVIQLTTCAWEINSLWKSLLRDVLLNFKYDFTQVCCAIGHQRTYNQYKQKLVQPETGSTLKRECWHFQISTSDFGTSFYQLLFSAGLGAFSWHTLHKVSQAIRCVSMVTQSFL